MDQQTPEAQIAERFGEAPAEDSAAKVRLLPLSEVDRRVRRSWGIHATGEILDRLYLHLPVGQ